MINCLDYRYSKQLRSDGRIFEGLSHFNGDEIGGMMTDYENVFLEVLARKPNGSVANQSSRSFNINWRLGLTSGRWKSVEHATVNWQSISQSCLLNQSSQRRE